MSKARSPRASCSMTIGTSGICVSVLTARGPQPAARRSVLRTRPPPRLLAGARPSLLREPPLLRRLRRLRGPARARHAQRAVEPLGEALERQHAVARLTARLLGHRCHTRAEPRHHPALLLVG